MSVYVDNFDTSQIQYYDATSDEPWFYLVINQAVNVYNNSLSVIEGLGSAVFRFTGSSVDVYGTEMHPLNGAEVISHYTLDQQISVMHISNDWVVEQDGIPFYSSGDISYGDHVLVISVMQASGSAPYCLDYISYSTNVSSSSSSSLASSFSSSSTSSAAAATNTTDTGLPTMSTTPVVEKSNNVNVIVGGVIGGAVGLIAIILAVFFFCFGRRALQRYTARKTSIRSELPTEITDVTPYFASGLVSSPHMSEAQSPTPLQASRAPGERSSLNPPEATPSSFTLTPEDSASQAGLGALMVSPSASRLTGSRKPGMPPPIASEPPAVHHADSGLRFTPETISSEAAPDVPPLYTSN